MLLHINHVTEYTYDEPIQFSLQRLRMTPVDSAGQTVRDWSVTIEGAKSEVAYVDQFQSHVRLVSADGEQKSVRLIASGIVETRDTDGIFGPGVACRLIFTIVHKQITGYVARWHFHISGASHQDVSIVLTHTFIGRQGFFSGGCR